MIIRCPHCEYARTVNSGKIPAGAEVATCPKCKARFRFRTLEPDEKPAPPPLPQPREKAPADIWEAVDALSRTLPQPAEAPRTRRPGQPDKRSAEQSAGHFADEPRRAGREPAGHSPFEPDHAGPDDAGPGHAEQDADEAARAESRQKGGSRRAAPEKSAKAEETGSTPWGAKIEAFFRRRLGTDAGTSADPTPERAAGPSLFSDAESAVVTTDGASAKPMAGPSAESGAGPVTIPVAEPVGGSAAEPSTVPDNDPLPPPSSGRADAGELPLLSPATPAEAPATPGQQLPPARSDTPAFPYGDDEITPEERVERDMRLLLEEEERPVRDLGRIDEWDRAADGEADAASGIPWEKMGTYGKLGGFAATVRRALLRPTAFFSDFGVSDTLAPAYLFFTIQTYLALAGTLLWRLALSAVLNDTSLFAPTRLALPILLITAPLFMGLVLMFCAGVVRAFLRVMAPAGADFPGIFKILCYASSAFVFCIIPLLGPFVAWLWYGIALVVGFRHGLGLPWTTAALAALAPAVLLPGGMAALFI